MSRISERDASEHRGDRHSFHGRLDPSGRGRRGRGAIAVVGWVVGLGAVIALATQGGAAPERAAPSAAAVVTSSSSAPVGRRQLALDQPARRGDVVTTRELIVRGRVARTAGEVRIMLESRGGKPVATAAIDPIGYGHGDWIPFESRFRLEMPRPAGDMTLFIVAVDGAGIPIDAVRRRFTIGAIIDISAVTGGRRSRSNGEDGLMGGIPFGTNVLPGT